MTYEITFGGVPAVPLEEADAVILPVPYDGTTSYHPGTRWGPQALLLASANMELFDLALGLEVTEAVRVHTASPLERALGQPGAMVDRVREAVQAILGHKAFPLLLGGEHSLTLGALQALKIHLGHPPAVLQLDAHLDLRDSFEGTPFSHASVMRRAAELGCPVVSVGIRVACLEEVEYLNQHRGWGTVFRPPIAPHLEAIVEAIPMGDLYLSLDLDGLDPSIMPGTGTPEPGGVTWLELMSLLEALFARHRVVGADVVELLPLAGSTLSEDGAARLVLRLLGLWHGQRSPGG